MRHRTTARRLLLAALLLGAAHAARGDVAQEYAVKAAFLVNFADFIEWPEGAAGPGGVLTIGVVGRDPFGAALDKIVASKNASGARFAVQRFARAEEMTACQILFVNLRDENVRDLLGALADRPTLTVGDTADFARAGGMIHFFVDSDRVSFEINQASAERANLKISAKLLRLQKKAPR